MSEQGDPEIAQALAAGTLVPLGEPAEPGTERLAFGRCLRIALAMKGGISLAVWIGGAAAELDILRRLRILGTRANPAAYLLLDPGDATGELVLERARVYARSIISRGYDRVEFDVLAGASAGGLNGVLYGVSQRQGVAIDALLDTWMESGAIWNLLRDPGFTGIESALEGDEFFWPAAMSAIETLYKTPGNDAHRANRVIVDLSGTVVDHDDIRRVGPHERAGHFHFVGSPDVLTEKGRAIPSRPYPAADGSDADEPLDPTARADIARLSYAARSTSSFPAAFEPALIWSPNNLDEATLVDDTVVDMRFAFHLQRGRPEEPRRPFRVIDGGVTDNIPIDRAYRAVRDMPTERFGDRAIIYLEPDPKTLGRNLTPSGPVDAPNPSKPGARRRDAVSGFIRTIRAGISGRGIHESADDEIDAIEEFRRLLYLEQGRDESYAVTATGAEGDYERDAAREAYVRFRSTADLGTLSRVLCNPSLWQLGSDLPTRIPREPIPAGFLAGLDVTIFARYGAAAATGAPHHDAVVAGTQALVDATRCAIAWTRKLEALAFAQPDAVAGLDLEARFLSLRSELMPIARIARLARDQRFDRLQLGVMGLAAANEHPADPPAEIVGMWLEIESAAAPGEVDIAPWWGKLTGCVTTLRELTNALETRAGERVAVSAADTGLRDGLDETPWATVPRFDAAFAAGDLAPFAAARGIPEPVSAIRFARITGSERPAESLAFGPLREAQLALTVERWLALDKEEFGPAAIQLNVPEHLDANAKLAGSALGHFGAFLSRDWRRNDWWWGRMDAGAGILRFFDTLRAVDGREVALEPAIGEVQSLMLRQAGPVVAPRVKADAAPDAIAEGMSAGAHTVRNLRPGYLVAVASRAVRVVGRALARGFGFKQFLARVLAPPLLVAAPLIAHPVRAVVALALVFAALAAASSPVYGLYRLFGVGDAPPPPVDPYAAAWWTESAFWFWVVLAVAGLVAVAALAWGAWATSREQWRKLRDDELSDPAPDLAKAKIDPDTHRLEHPLLTGILARRRTRAVRTAWLATAGGVAFTAIAVVTLAADQGLSIRFWAVYTGAIGCGLYVRSRAKRLPDQSRYPWSRAFWVFVAAVATLLALTPELTRAAVTRVESWAIMPWVPEGTSLHLTTTLALCAGLLAIVLGWGWLGATNGPGGRIAVLWILLVAVASAVAVFIIAGLVEATFPTSNSLVTTGVAVTIAAWFSASWAFWYLGEFKNYLAYPASDSAEFAD